MGELFQVSASPLDHAMTSNQKYIENAKELIEFERLNRRRWLMCKDCRWSKVKYTFSKGPENSDFECLHPLVEVASKDVTKPTHGEYLKQCDAQRSEKSIWGKVVCGPDALLYEEMPPLIKTPRKGFIQRFLKVFKKLGRSN